MSGRPNNDETMSVVFTEDIVQAVRTREVSFYDDSLLAVQAADNTIYVPIRRLCANLGLQPNGQIRRIQDNEVLNEGLKPSVTS